VRRAGPAQRERLAETFAALCRIASPFGHERECADAVAARLRAPGLAVEEDGAAGPAEAGAGNLLARLPGRGGDDGPWLLLCAHLDTVDTAVPVDPVVVDGAWENANDGILGADNKAAIAVILETARAWVHAPEPPPVGLELLFTVAEENGLRGALALDRGRLRARTGYVFDHATPIGEVIVASPTMYRLRAEFHGRAAHAGIRPEAGRSAILAAARAVAAMPLGRLDPGTTTNVGNIEGGVGSTNVVPERCTLLAEARAVDPGRAEAVVADLLHAVQDGAVATECDVDVDCEKLFAGYRIRPSDPAVQAAEAALRACGHEPLRVTTGGASDANALHSSGLTMVNLANGTEHNHEPTERVTVSALEGMLDVSLALVDEVAARAC